jgi:hypothetical protein
MQRQDYVERMIRQIAEAIGRALGFTQSGQHDDAQRELDGAWASAIGMRRGDVTRLDEATLRALLGAKARAASMLLDAQADLDVARGEEAAAGRLRDLAERLRR